MKHLSEFRDSRLVKGLVKELAHITKNSWNIMEVCGGQTHTIVKYGLKDLLPESINLIHGPGCPVCVTPQEKIDLAIELAKQENIILCSYGDMLRVPGSSTDLLSIRAQGGDVRVLYSPMEALQIAQKEPDKQVVFFAVGFETTAPAHAMAVYKAKQLDLKNFSLLVSHVLVPPALESLMQSQETNINGFLAAGHVCTVMGYEEYKPLVKKYNIPIVVTGFEPLDIMQGLQMCVLQLEEGRAEVENQYSRSVKETGNVNAQNLISKVFTIVSRNWRGIGNISNSGFSLKPEFEEFDAEKKFTLSIEKKNEIDKCQSGKVLQGIIKPFECPEFGKSCTPENPLGAPMVSTEGACAAYYKFKTTETATQN